MNWSELWPRLREHIQNLSPWQKAAATAAVILVVLGGTFFILRGSGDFAPLFTQLTPDDAAAIVEQLEQRGIAYEIADNGGTLLVPRADVHSTRLALAAEGLPKGGVVGLEVLDSFQFGATEFERRMSFLRALQGELTRTISRLDGVENARVHLTLPEPSLFVSERKAATASVLLELRPGHTLEPGQVQAIANLVAGSVEDLAPEEVTIIDMHGRLLSSDLPAGMQPSAGSRSQENLEVQANFQAELEAGVEKLLEPIFGSGNVVARVWADINFDETAIESQLFEPVEDPETMLRSVQELEERFEGTGAAAEVPGVDSNIPAYQAALAGGDSEYERTENIRNFELNEIREHRVLAPGSVSRLSVSVIVNRLLDEADRLAVEEAVAASLGYDADRNDQVHVLGTAFDTTLADQIRDAMEADAASEALRQRQMLIAAGVLGGLLLIVLILVLIARRRRRAAQLQEAALKEALEAEIAPAEPEQLVPDLVENGDQLRQRQVERLAKERPEEVAQVLRTWLAEEG